LQQLFTFPREFGCRNIKTTSSAPLLALSFIFQDLFWKKLRLNRGNGEWRKDIERKCFAPHGMIMGFNQQIPRASTLLHEPGMEKMKDMQTQQGHIKRSEREAWKTEQTEIFKSSVGNKSNVT